jgi:hypothetical protein
MHRIFHTSVPRGFCVIALGVQFAVGFFFLSIKSVDEDQPSWLDTCVVSFLPPLLDVPVTDRHTFALSPRLMVA